jgi:hypothetical protein
VEIHKPKPAHNWRELLTEIGVVVIGVCIALGAEQAVEWVHWRNEVGAAREVLREEIGGNNSRFFARRLAIAPCFERQVREADSILSNLEAGRAAGKFTVYHFGSGSLISDGEWQSERASQVLTHFPRAERTVLSRYYALLPSVNDWVVAEAQAWRELSGLQNPPPGLTASDLMHLRVNLQNAREMLNLITLIAPRLLRYSDQLGVAEPAVDADAVKNFCTMDDDRYQQFLRKSRPR